VQGHRLVRLVVRLLFFSPSGPLNVALLAPFDVHLEVGALKLVVVVHLVELSPLEHLFITSTCLRTHPGAGAVAWLLGF
jgi:hypothetical protein